MTRFRSDAPGAAGLRPDGTKSRGVWSGLFSVAWCTVARSAVAWALISFSAQAAPQAGERVALTACPHAGITAPCLIITGADGTLYNITGAAQKPPLNGRMIRLRATVSDKLSACLQGIVLDRIRWTPVRQKCTN
jgi:hypothetical protein